MSKVMVFTHSSEPKSEWLTREGTVWYHEDGYKLRGTCITHKDLHDPRYGFKFKELRNE